MAATIIVSFLGGVLLLMLEGVREALFFDPCVSKAYRGYTSFHKYFVTIMFQNNYCSLFFQTKLKCTFFDTKYFPIVGHGGRAV